jgi:hypothetical protein
MQHSAGRGGPEEVGGEEDVDSQLQIAD